MSVLGLILARKNSKRLPGKNMKLLNGKPLIQYTINVALKSNILSTIIIGSDDEKIEDFVIKNYSKENKIKFIKLPDNVTQDHSTAEDATFYILKKVKKHDYIMLLQPTSPIRDIEDFYEMIIIKNTNERKYNVDIPVCSVDRSTGKLNGSFYLISNKKLFETKNFCRDIYKKNIYDSYYMDHIKSIDIDFKKDFDKVEEIIKKRGEKNVDYREI